MFIKRVLIIIYDDLCSLNDVNIIHDDLCSLKDVNIIYDELMFI